MVSVGKFGGHAVAGGWPVSTTKDDTHFRGLVPDFNFAQSAAGI
jgi:hypothetical protein